MQRFQEFQVSLLGTAGVGKTSMVLRYTKNEFSPIYTPNLLDNVYFKYTYKGTNIILIFFKISYQFILKSNSIFSIFENLFD